VVWKYTTSDPGPDWAKLDFNDSGWQSGTGPIGAQDTPGLHPKTDWHTENSDIWLRREVVIPESSHTNLKLKLFHDDAVEVYINGVLAASDIGALSQYETMGITSEAKDMLKGGAKVVLAVKCHQDGGGQGVDVGIGDAPAEK
jgi:hypothetical protein